jgi:GNAT superfamily N-acetyltransferase
MQKTLRDGLVLRSLSEHPERERLSRFYVDVYADDGEAHAKSMAAWAADLTSGKHPTVSDDDVWMVIDPTRDNEIVSALILIPQVWRYEDVTFNVGRPELIGTKLEYRRRGLVRALMDAAHERAAAIGCNVTGITGIPFFYRQFGYTMAVDLGGQAYISVNAVPALPAGKSSTYTLRPAAEHEIDDMLAWDEWAARDVLLSVVRDANIRRYDLFGIHPESSFSLDQHLIVTRGDIGVGYLVMRHSRTDPVLEVYRWVIGPESSYLDTYEDVLRGLRQYIEDSKPPDQRPTMIGFDSVLHTTLLTLFERTLSASVYEGDYAWYLRAASYAQLMRDIAPVLERRLEASGAHRFTGEMVIDKADFTGLRMIFSSGRLAEAADISMDGRESDVSFPMHSFLSLVFGHRDYRQLHHAMPDCFATGKAEALFNILFPRKRSALYPVS